MIFKQGVGYAGYLDIWDIIFHQANESYFKSKRLHNLYYLLRKVDRN